MTASTTPRAVTGPAEHHPRWKFDVKADEILVAGTLVQVDSSQRAINAAASGGLYVGVWPHEDRGTLDATGLSDGDLEVELQFGPWGPFENSAMSDAITVADRGKPCFRVDNSTLALTSNGGTRTRAGTVHDVTSRGVYVCLEPPQEEKIQGVGGAYTQTYNTADRTIANPTATAIGTSLTDNSGFSGTHDDTMAASATPAALTDNSSFAGGANDTLEAAASPTSLTDNSGFSGTHDDTMAASATPAALLVGTLGGAADGTMEVVGATNTGDVSGAIQNNFQELFEKFNALRTQVDTIAQNVSDVAAKVIELVTQNSATGQNVSDVAAKTNALRTQVDTIAQNVSDVAAKVIESVTQGNALIADDLDNRRTLVAVTTDLENAGIAA